MTAQTDRKFPKDWRYFSIFFLSACLLLTGFTMGLMILSDTFSGNDFIWSTLIIAFVPLGMLIDFILQKYWLVEGDTLIIPMVLGSKKIIPRHEIEYLQQGLFFIRLKRIGCSPDKYFRAGVKARDLQDSFPFQFRTTKLEDQIAP